MATYDDKTLKSIQDRSAEQTQAQNAQNQKTMDANLKGLSDATKTQLGTLQQGYKPSTAVQAAQNYLKDLQAAKPQDYTSQYDADIQNAYQQIMNRPGFKYDPNADALFQQYRDDYIRSGQRAMQDTMGQAAAMTGGYGNSYAQTAGQQVYQDYLSQVNSAMPEFYALAADQYAREGDNLLNRYQTALTAEEQAYGRWQDEFGRWQSERAAAENTYNTERGYDYGKYQDQLNYWQNLAQMEQSNYWQGQSQAYQMAMAMIQNGQTPSEDLLYAANISPADAAAMKALYASQGGGGGGGRRRTPGDSTDLTVDEQAEVFKRLYSAGGFDMANQYLSDSVASGDIKHLYSTDAYKAVVNAESALRKEQQEKKAAEDFEKKMQEIRDKLKK